MQKRVLAILVASALLMACFPASAMALDGVIVQPFYQFTHMISPSLSFNNGTATCYLDVEGNTGVTQITITSVRLQRVYSGWATYTVASWSSSNYPEMTAYTDYITFGKYASVTAGYKYRMSFDIEVHKGSQVEYISDKIERTY